MTGSCGSSKPENTDRNMSCTRDFGHDGPCAPHPNVIGRDHIVHLSLTAGEGYLIRVMLEAALQQYNEASYAERIDPDLVTMKTMLERIIPLLPSAA
jgi:hypothetical protein